MRKIKVLLASRPKILSEVLRTVVGQQPDMEVQGEVCDPIELLFIAHAMHVDAIIVTPLEAREEPSICRHLFEGHPHLKIVTVSAKGDSTCLYQLGREKKLFKQASWQLILDAIRESINQNAKENKL